MNKDFSYSEQNLIKRAILHMKTHTATKEEQLLVKMYKMSKFQSALDKIYDEITPIDNSTYNLKDAFTNFENAFITTYNAIYPLCGNCIEYTMDNLYDYMGEVLTGKMNQNMINSQKPTKTFILLDIIRDEMDDDKWYSMSEMYDLLNKYYPEYNGILKRENMMIIVEKCIADGYFDVFVQTNGGKNGKINKRLFKKTHKPYVDYIEEKSILCNKSIK